MRNGMIAMVIGLFCFSAFSNAQTVEMFEPAGIEITFPDGWFIDGFNEQGALVYWSEFADIQAIVHKFEVEVFEDAIAHPDGLIATETQKGNAIYSVVDLDFALDSNYKVYLCEQNNAELYDFYIVLLETPNGTVSVTFVGFLEDLQSLMDDVHYIINSVSS